MCALQYKAKADRGVTEEAENLGLPAIIPVPTPRLVQLIVNVSSVPLSVVTTYPTHYDVPVVVVGFFYG